MNKDRLFLAEIFVFGLAVFLLPMFGLKAYYLQAEKEALALYRQKVVLANNSSDMSNPRVLGESCDQRKNSDIDCDGKLNVKDFNIWLANYISYLNTTPTPPAGQATATLTPKPSNTSVPTQGPTAVPPTSTGKIYPWSDNGPRAAYAYTGSDQRTHLLALNREYWWGYSFDDNKWGAAGRSLKSTWETMTGMAAASDGTYPWTDNGPVSAYVIEDNLIVINKGYWWSYNFPANKWGKATSLSDTWKIMTGMVAASDGTYPWTDNGPSASYYVDGYLMVFNKGYWWGYNASANKWETAGVKLSTAWSGMEGMAAASDGTYPWTDNGPNSAYAYSFDGITHLIVINKGYWWGYNFNEGKWKVAGRSLKDTWQNMPGMGPVGGPYIPTGVPPSPTGNVTKTPPPTNPPPPTDIPLTAPPASCEGQSLEVCCAGTTRTRVMKESGTSCIMLSPVTYKCMACGNKVCNSAAGENKCTCPADCK